MRRTPLLPLALLALPLALVPPSAHAEDGFLSRLRHQDLLISTVPENGDQNPYAIVIAPVSAGKVQKNDVLVDDFNDKANLQGRGSTILGYRPGQSEPYVFTSLPKDLAGCPGGVGLTTAMTMLSTGYVIVGSLPSKDGTTATKGQGCLIVLDAEGKVAAIWQDPKINGPWGNMALREDGDHALLFVSNTGFDVGAPSDNAPVVPKATVLRLTLRLHHGAPPVIENETVIADGFGEKADKDVFIIGPTGLALDADGTLYVADALGNRITAIEEATTRTTSAGTGREITRDGFLKRPLALAFSPEHHLITTNALDGEAVEIDPQSGRQFGTLWLDKDPAQNPPGSGDLFGLAVKEDGKGLYYVEDDKNTLMLAH